MTPSNFLLSLPGGRLDASAADIAEAWNCQPAGTPCSKLCNVFQCYIRPHSHGGLQHRLGSVLPGRHPPARRRLEACGSVSSLQSSCPGYPGPHSRCTGLHGSTPPASTPASGRTHLPAQSHDPGYSTCVRQFRRTRTFRQGVYSQRHTSIVACLDEANFRGCGKRQRGVEQRQDVQDLHCRAAWGGRLTARRVPACIATQNLSCKYESI